jgi:hypothetical protein
MLLAQARRQRQDIGRALAPLAGTLRIADKAWSGVQWAKENPLAVAAGVAAFAVIQPRRAIRWTRLGLEAWTTWKMLEEKLR